MLDPLSKWPQQRTTASDCVTTRPVWFFIYAARFRVSPGRVAILARTVIVTAIDLVITQA
jgi:hypothetical protein